MGLELVNLSITDAFSFADPITHLGEYGLDFDGANDYVPTLAVLSARSTFTLSGWLKTTAIDYQIIFGGNTGPNPGDYTWYVRTAIDGDDIVIGSEDGGWGGVTYVQPNVNDGKWHHLAITFNGATNTWKIYWDGVYTGVSLVKDYSAAATVWLGNIYPTYANKWGGVLDEVHLHDRVLSADEIRKLAAKKKPTLDADTIGLWHMDENGGSGDLVVDASPNRNNGTRIGPTYVWTGDKPFLGFLFIDDFYSLADAIASQFGPAFKEISLTDAFTLADIVSRQEIFYRALTDNFNLADVPSTQETYYQLLEDGFSLADLATTQEVYTRLLTDAYALADIFTKQEIYYRFFVDGYGFADVLTTLMMRRLLITDAFTLADALSTQEVYNLLFTDAYTLADTITALKAIIKEILLTDAFDLADILSTQEIYNRVLAEGFDLADVLATKEVYYRTLTDAYGFADIITTIPYLIISLTDAFALGDILTTYYQLKSLILTDVFSLADVLTKQWTHKRLLTDAYSYTDILLRIGPIINQPISDGYSLAGPITHLGEYGLYFDGVDDVVTVADSPSLSGLRPFSVAFWLKTSVSDATSRYWGKYATNAREWYVAYRGSDDYIWCLVYDENANAHITRHRVGAGLNDGKWHHVVFMWNGGTTPPSIRIYNDGVQIDNSSTLAGVFSTIRDTTAPIEIGGLTIAGKFEGTLDEVCIFNRVLSLEEVRKLAAKRKPTLDDDPVSLWHMDENGGSGDLVVDASSNRNHGTRGPAYPANVPNYVWTGDKPIPLSIEPDAFSLLDILLRIGPIINQPISDGFSLADIAAMWRSRLLTLADNYNLADLLATQKVFYRSLTDACSLADPLTVLRSRPLSLSDNYSFADVFTKMVGLYQLITDGYSFTDVLSTQEIFYRALVDAYQLADPITILRFRLLTISDNYALADIPSVQKVYYRSLTDFYNLADPITAFKFKALSITDRYSLADVYSTQWVYDRLITDAYSFRDRLLRGAFIETFLADAYALADIRSVIKNPIALEKLIAKLIQLIDLQGR